MDLKLTPLQTKILQVLVGKDGHSIAAYDIGIKIGAKTLAVTISLKTLPNKTSGAVSGFVPPGCDYREWFVYNDKIESVRTILSSQHSRGV
ncbi:MAG: hypothetical protein PHE67_00150 [Campylobacterales bacterium]|nr:hypothetical protein [Campylobacterales bacterium]